MRIEKKDLVWFVICLIIILCFIISISIVDNSKTSNALSLASTISSIILSLVAILYTMIEGSNSSRLNQDTKNKLDGIGSQINELTHKTEKIKEIDKQIRSIIPALSSTVEIIKAENSLEIDENLKQSMVTLDDNLNAYMNENLDD